MDTPPLVTPGVECALAERSDPGFAIWEGGRNAMHRVTPVVGARTRVLVVLAYNAEPGVSLSESARMTFYGRLS